MSFKKIDIEIEGIELDEEFQKQVQKAKNILNIDDINLDIFLRIISGEKVSLCISNLFDIFKLLIFFFTFFYLIFINIFFFFKMTWLFNFYL